jgi:CBS-domain-containing membrane protein
MVALRVLHPPCVPIVIITSKASWIFLFRPVLIGAILLVLVATFYNNLFQNRRCPEYW